MAQPESRTAVELDEPTHYPAVEGAPPQPGGSTVLKRQLPAKLGWRLFSVLHLEWGALRSAAGELDYLARDRLLAGPLCTRPCSPPLRSYALSRTLRKWRHNTAAAAAAVLLERMIT